MDEGGFILDYLMPAGSSLEDTNQVLLGVEKILAATPEVESTSRRTGLQLGLAAVTEANTGDFAVKLKGKRSRTIDQVISEVREKVTKKYPQLDVDFLQILQDQIGDLTSSPEPIEIKLFAAGSGAVEEVGDEGGRSHQKNQGRRGLEERDREYDQRVGNCDEGGSGGGSAVGIYAAGNRDRRERVFAGGTGDDSGGGERPGLHDSRAVSAGQQGDAGPDQEHE